MYAFIGNIGLGEVELIALVAFLLFGERLPEVARSFGKAIGEFYRPLKEGPGQTIGPPIC